MFLEEAFFTLMLSGVFKSSTALRSPIICSMEGMFKGGILLILLKQISLVDAIGDYIKKIPLLQVWYKDVFEF